MNGLVAQLISYSAGMVCCVRAVMGSAPAIKEGHSLFVGGSGHILVTTQRDRYSERKLDNIELGTEAGYCRLLGA
jgi:hypothetical protein